MNRDELQTNQSGILIDNVGILFKNGQEFSTDLLWLFTFLFITPIVYCFLSNDFILNTSYSSGPFY